MKKFLLGVLIILLSLGAVLGITALVRNNSDKQNDEVNALKEDINIYLEQVVKLKGDLELENVKVTTLTNTITEKDESIKVLEDTIIVKETEIVEKEAEVKKVKEEVVVYKDKVVTLEKTIETKTEEVKTLEQEAIVDEARIKELEEQVEELQAQIKSLNSEITRLNNKVADLEAEIVSLNEQIDNLNARIEELEAENADLQAQLDQALEDINELNININVKTELIITLEARVEELENQLNTEDKTYLFDVFDNLHDLTFYNLNNGNYLVSLYSTHIEGHPVSSEYRGLYLISAYDYSLTYISDHTGYLKGITDESLYKDYIFLYEPYSSGGQLVCFDKSNNTISVVTSNFNKMCRLKDNYSLISLTTGELYLLDMDTLLLTNISVDGISFYDLFVYNVSSDVKDLFVLRCSTIGVYLLDFNNANPIITCIIDETKVYAVCQYAENEFLLSTYNDNDFMRTLYIFNNNDLSIRLFSEDKVDYNVNYCKKVDNGVFLSTGDPWYYPRGTWFYNDETGNISIISLEIAFNDILHFEDDMYLMNSVSLDNDFISSCYIYDISENTLNYVWHCPIVSYVGIKENGTIKVYKDIYGSLVDIYINSENQVVSSSPSRDIQLVKDTEFLLTDNFGSTTKLYNPSLYDLSLNFVSIYDEVELTLNLGDDYYFCGLSYIKLENGSNSYYDIDLVDNKFIITEDMIDVNGSINFAIYVREK